MWLWFDIHVMENSVLCCEWYKVWRTTLVRMPKLEIENWWRMGWIVFHHVMFHSILWTITFLKQWILNESSLISPSFHAIFILLFINLWKGSNIRVACHSLLFSNWYAICFVVSFALIPFPHCVWPPTVDFFFLKERKTSHITSCRLAREASSFGN